MLQDLTERRRGGGVLIYPAGRGGGRRGMSAPEPTLTWLTDQAGLFTAGATFP